MENTKIRVVLSPLFSGNVYLISQNGKHILFDTSDKSKLDKIVSSLRKMEVKFEDVLLILVSHSHHDHAGCVSQLKKMMENSKVVIHQSESIFLEKGKCNFPNGLNPITKIVSYFSKKKISEKKLFFEPIKADITVSTEILELNNFDGYILHCPGHSKGSIALVVGKNAFVGDTLFNLSIFKVKPVFGDNEKEIIQAIKKLIDTGCELFFPGHGKAIKRKDLINCYENYKKK